MIRVRNKKRERGKKRMTDKHTNFVKEKMKGNKNKTKE